MTVTTAQLSPAVSEAMALFKSDEMGSDLAKVFNGLMAVTRQTDIDKLSNPQVGELIALGLAAGRHNLAKGNPPSSLVSTIDQNKDVLVAAMTRVASGSEILKAQETALNKWWHINAEIILAFKGFISNGCSLDHNSGVA